MARPRTATKILELKGAFKHNPDRARPDEPESAAGFPDKPPKHLTANQKKIWNEIKQTVPLLVLTGSDVISFEVLVKLFEEFRTRGVDMPGNRLIRLCAEMGKFGLNPSDRAKLAVDKPTVKGNDGTKFE